MTVRGPHAKCWWIQTDKVLLKSVFYVLIHSVFISLNYGVYAGVCKHVNQIECVVSVVITS